MLAAQNCMRRILELYDMMKLTGAECNSSRRLTDRLAEKHRIEMNYNVMVNNKFEKFSKDGPSFPELISFNDCSML